MKDLSGMKGVAIAAGVLLAFGVALARAGSSYDISQWTVSGGGQIEVGKYVLDGTLGQPAVGELSLGNYTLGGGFWGGRTAKSASRVSYLPLVRH